MNYGTDVLRNWNLNNDGDLVLVSDVENVEQAIINRLRCDLNSLDLFYHDYGSILVQFLGWKRNNMTLEFIKLELENRLKEDERIDDFIVNVEYGEGTNTVLVYIVLYPNSNYVHTLKLELNQNGVEEVGD